MNNYKKKRGLVLSEALMSIAILAISITIMGSIITSAISMTTLSKNLMIAQGLATEGIEVVKAIRNTNWLKAPTDQGCWLRPDPIGSDCTTTPDINVSYYFESSSEGFKLISAAKDLDLSSEIGNLSNLVKFRLMEKEISVFQDQEYSYMIYVHDPLETDPDKMTNFFRSIKFNYYDANMAVISVRIEWFEGSKVRTLERTYKLYNYLE